MADIHHSSTSIKPAAPGLTNSAPAQTSDAKGSVPPAHPNPQPRLIVKHLHKSFKIPHERHTSLKQAALNWHRRQFETFEVLRDINFEVKDGEFFGIVGKNGSGKSTLLKLIAEIYQPTGGQITVHGKLTPFIELGVGFNMELTGRDNVFLNGAILGLTQREIAAKYDEIVAFAELERFMDQKLKNYSSGMLVRLAFSIAIQAHTDILLLDEVLAVGDAGFQKKCMNVFKNIKKQKKTVILVTHDMNAVQNFCDRAMLIDNGRVVTIGKSGKVAQAYNELNLERSLASQIEVGAAAEGGAAGSGPDGKQPDNKTKGRDRHDIKITSCQTILDGKPRRIFKPGQKIGVRVVYKVTAAIENPIFGIIIKDLSGQPLFATNTKAAQHPTGTVQPGQTVTMEITVDNIFNDGSYTISPAVADDTATIFYDWVEEAARFEVTGWDFPAALMQPPHELSLRTTAS